VAKRRRLCLGLLCHGFATLGLEPAHGLLQPQLGGVQVSARLRQIRVPQHLLHMMDRPALLEPPAAGFVTEIVEVQVNGSQGRTRRL
jgi:hypothetical protein